MFKNKLRFIFGIYLTFSSCSLLAMPPYWMSYVNCTLEYTGETFTVEGNTAFITAAKIVEHCYNKAPPPSDTDALGPM